MQSSVDRLEAMSNVSGLVAGAERLLPSVLAAVVVLAVFFVIHRLFDRAVHSVMRRAHVDETAQGFVSSVLRTALLTIAVVAALSQLGINTGSLLASLGVAGLTLGFAAKDVLSNLIAGLFIFFDRPFVIGDLIEVGNSYGRVEKITLRSTRVVTVDGKMLAIPNSIIANSTVTSYTNFPNLRIDIPLTIGVGEDLQRVGDLMLNVVRAHPQYLDTPAPRFVLKSVNDYNLEVEVQVWIRDEKQHIQVRFDLRRQLFEALRDANVEMPYETLQLLPRATANDAS